MTYGLRRRYPGGEEPNVSWDEEVKELRGRGYGDTKSSHVKTGVAMWGDREAGLKSLLSGGAWSVWEAGR